MFVHDSAALLFHGISAFSLTDKRNGFLPASSKGRKERYKRKSASRIFLIFTESRGSIRCIIKKKCSCQSPLPAGVPRYSMIKGFVVVTNWIRTSTSGSKRQAQRTTIHSDRDFVYPVPLAAKGYIRVRSHGPTYLACRPAAELTLVLLV